MDLEPVLLAVKKVNRECEGLPISSTSFQKGCQFGCPHRGAPACWRARRLLAGSAAPTLQGASSAVCTPFTTSSGGRAGRDSAVGVEPPLSPPDARGLLVHIIRASSSTSPPLCPSQISRRVKVVLNKRSLEELEGFQVVGASHWLRVAWEEIFLLPAGPVELR